MRKKIVIASSFRNCYGNCCVILLIMRNPYLTASERAGKNTENIKMWRNNEKTKLEYVESVEMTVTLSRDEGEF